MLTWFCFINRTVLTSPTCCSKKTWPSSENAPSASFSHVDMLWKKHGSSMFQWNTQKKHYNLAICFCEWTKMNTHWSFILVWREGYKVLTRTQIVCFGRNTVQCFTSKLVCKTRCDISILPQEFLVEWIEPISLAPCTGEKNVSLKYIMR